MLIEEDLRGETRTPISKCLKKLKLIPGSVINLENSPFYIESLKDLVCNLK